ncbi:hypothetical protein [Kingella sp. (in: b-proteobacteria)]|nr:hypothetical protein [Kingella sp. (in: b-proteobacteria)]MDO4658038.1 hypothetical protein [Kingella sp. (in: b-proteobacteria)]
MFACNQRQPEKQFNIINPTIIQSQDSLKNKTVWIEPNDFFYWID